MKHGVDELEGVHSDQRVVGVEINNNVIFIAMVDDADIPILQCELSFLVVNLYDPDIGVLCNILFLHFYQLFVSTIINKDNLIVLVLLPEHSFQHVSIGQLC